jgi:hypothetical protein
MTEAATIIEPPVSPAAAEPVVSYINEDLSLKEGWRNSLVPEDLREESVFKDMEKNPALKVQDVFKMLGGLQKVIGKKGLIQPTDSSTPSEWDMFYKTLGRPDKADGYKLEYPKELATIFPEDADDKKEFMEHAFKNGKTQKQAQADYDFYNGIVKRGIAKQAQDKTNATTQLKEELGVAFNDYIGWGKRLVGENAEGEHKDNLLAKFGDDPDLIKFLGNIGKKLFSESRGIPNSAEKQTGMTVPEAKAKMDEIAKTLADKTLIYNNPGLQARLTKEMEGYAKLVSQSK